MTTKIDYCPTCDKETEQETNNSVLAPIWYYHCVVCGTDTTDYS